jgi:hypothetical protein
MEYDRMKKLLIILVASILLSFNCKTNTPAYAYIDTVTVDSSWAISDTILTLYRFHIQVFTVNLTDTLWDTTHVVTGFLQFGTEFPDEWMRATIEGSSGFDSTGSWGYSMIFLEGPDTMYAMYSREGRYNRKYWTGGAKP